MKIILSDIMKELTIHASQETCFKVFTEKLNLWWPREYHVGKTPATEFILDPGPNGRWFSKHEDGSEVNIGHVLEWNPNDRLVLNWQLGGDYLYHQDLRTEVELRFIALDDSSTLVKFAHRNIDRLKGGDKNIYEMDHGWGYILEFYKKLTENKR